MLHNNKYGLFRIELRASGGGGGNADWTRKLKSGFFTRELQ